MTGEEWTGVIFMIGAAGMMLTFGISLIVSAWKVRDEDDDDD